MLRAAVIALIAAVLCAGCGSVEGQTTTKAAAVEPSAIAPPQPPGHNRRASWSTEMFFATGDYNEEGAPLAETLGVMNEPRTPADQLPGWAEGMLDGVADAPTTTRARRSRAAAGG